MSYMRQPHAVAVTVWSSSMKTAAEYRAMADECFQWAREAQTDEVRESYLQLARIWLNTASKLDGLPPTRSPPAPDKATKTTCSVSEA
jgi:hypothetical protein